MSSNEVYIPWILRLKVLRENRKYFFFIVILNYFIWVVSGVKANMVDLLIKDPGMYFHPIGVIFVFLAANLVIKRYIDIFGVDIYNSVIIPKESEKPERTVEKIFKDEDYAKYQQEILDMICNKNEKILIMIFLIPLFLAGVVFEFLITGDLFGAMYHIRVYPWTLIGCLTGVTYWTLFISPLCLSLFWLLVGMMRGINLMWTICNSKLKIWEENAEVIYTISLKKIEYSIKPILDFIYLVSSLILIFAFMYTSAIIWMNMTYNAHLLYFHNLLVVSAGLAIFIWPQLNLHKILKYAKENMLSNYYDLYNLKEKEYLNNLKEAKDCTVAEATRNDLSTLGDIINQTEKFDTWPYFSRIYKLSGAGLGSVILILIQFFIK